MEVLWDLGPASVQAVQQRLVADYDREYAHTTIHTMLNVLVKKGKVKRTAKERAHVYRPAVTRGEVVKQTVKEVVDKLFAGSAAGLVMNVMETRDLTPDDVAQLRKRLEEISHDTE
jgi:predicted transcriptional regulator